MQIRVLASGSGGNAYLVSDGFTVLLLEAGIPWKQLRQALNFKTSEIAACLLSHEHLDHAKSVSDVMKAGIDVYCSRGTIDALGLSGHRVHTVQPREQFTIGSWSLLAFETVHDANEPVGFLLGNRAGEKLLYATDTAYIHYRFRGLTHIMIECNYAEGILQSNVENGIVSIETKRRVLRSHMSLETLKQMLKANDLSQVQGIWLLHLSDHNSDRERFREEIEELTGKAVYVA